MEIMSEFFDHIESAHDELQLTELSLVQVILPLKFSFNHAAKKRKSNETIFLIGRLPNGQHCAGECLTRPYVTGESVADVQSTIVEEINAYRNDYLRRPWQTLKARRAELLIRRGGIGALCLLELCILDGILRISPLTDPFFNRKLPQITVTVPLLPRSMNFIAGVFSKICGPKAIKLKMSGDLHSDQHILKYFANSAVDVRIDLNGALNTDQASAYLEILAGKYPEVRWIEEPLNVKSRNQIQILQKRFGSHFIFCGDESIIRASDLETYASLKDAGAVNLRVGKHGGVVETVNIGKRAHELSLNLQMGSLVGETNLLTSAGIVAAASVPQIRYAELGLSPKLLKWQPFDSWFRVTRVWEITAPKGSLSGFVPPFDPQKIFDRATLVNKFQLQ